MITNYFTILFVLKISKHLLYYFLLKYFIRIKFPLYHLKLFRCHSYRRVSNVMPCCTKPPYSPIMSLPFYSHKSDFLVIYANYLRSFYEPKLKKQSTLLKAFCHRLN